MFAQTLHIALVCDHSPPQPVPLRWLDSFAMRNFTNSAVFDDTLPVADGLLQAGFRVPLPALAAALEQWFRRKGWLAAGFSVSVSLQGQTSRIQPANFPQEHRMQFTSLQKLLIDELQEIYISESLVSEALGRMATGADAPPLKKVLADHGAKSKEQLARLQSIFEILEDSPRGGHGKSMRALLSETEDRLGDAGDPPVIDAALLATVRRIAHWEIASYGTAQVYAERMELDKVAPLLAQTLAEEQSMDASLLQLSKDLPLRGSGDHEPQG